MTVILLGGTTVPPPPPPPPPPPQAPPVPVVSDAAWRLYEALGATTKGDGPGNGWLLLHLCHALTLPIATVDALAADTEDHAGWSGLFDVNRCPPQYLPYLAQFVGVRALPGLDPESQRLRITSAEGWQRGTPAAIVAAAKQWLTGDRDVTLNERYTGSAYKIRIVVYEAQATDVEQLNRAVAAAVPAGIVATVDVVAGWTVDDFETTYAGQTVGNAEAAYAGQAVFDFERTLP